MSLGPNPAAMAMAQSTATFTPSGTELAGITKADATSGGLATSPNVPAPGTSINPATGLPNTAGLTRAELEAKRRAAESGSLAGTLPASSAASSVSSDKGKSRDPSEVSGFEQAARQLHNPAASPAEPMSRPVAGDKAVDANDLSVHTLSGDIKEGLQAVSAYLPATVQRALGGQLAGTTGTGTTQTATGAATTTDAAGRRGSIPFEERVEHTVDYLGNLGLGAAKRVEGVIGSVTHQLQDATGVGGTSATTGGVTGGEKRGSMFGAMFASVKEVFGEPMPADSNLSGSTRSQVASKTSSSTAPSAASVVSAPGTNQSRFPGETSVFDARPDTSGAAGPSGSASIEIPPDASPDTVENAFVAPAGAATVGAAFNETRVQGSDAPIKEALSSTDAARETQPAVQTPAPAAKDVNIAAIAAEEAAMIAGATSSSSAGAPILGGALPSTASATKTQPVVQSEPVKKETVEAAATAAASAATVGALAADMRGDKPMTPSVDATPQPVMPSSSAASAPAPAPASSEPRLMAVAPPAEVPQPFSTSGGTSIESVPETSTINSSSTAGTGPIASAVPPALLSAKGADSRLDSSASVTAIRDGKIGGKPDVNIPTDGAIDRDVKSSSTSAGRTTGLSDAVDHAPGDASGAIGHPSTAGQPGTSREPGTYPKVDYDAPAEHPTGNTHRLGESNGSAGTTTKFTESGLGTAGTVKPASSATESTPASTTQTTSSPATKTTDATHTTHVASGDTHHRRTSSGGASDGKKKVGFMSKLKGEMKVISGKVSGDKDKVEQGEKMKHGA